MGQLAEEMTQKRRPVVRSRLRLPQLESEVLEDAKWSGRSGDHLLRFQSESVDFGSEIRLDSCMFTSAEVDSAPDCQAYLRRVEFKSSTLDRLTIALGKLDRCTFLNSRGVCWDLRNLEMSSILFRGCRLDFGMIISCSAIEPLIFQECKLDGMVFKDCKFGSLGFIDCAFTDVAFIDCTIEALALGGDLDLGHTSGLISSAVALEVEELALPGVIDALLAHKQVDVVSSTILRQ